MSEQNHHQWSTSKYRQRRSERLANKQPEWVTAPSGAQFFVRKVGMMPYLVAGKLPRSLSADAAEAWESKGVGDSSPSQVITPEDVAEGQRNLALMARVLGEAVVTPKLTNNPQSDDELDPSELEEDDLWYLFRYATGQLSGVRMQGGQVMPMGSLQNFPKKPGRRIRTGTGG